MAKLGYGKWKGHTNIAYYINFFLHAPIYSWTPPNPSNPLHIKKQIYAPHGVWDECLINTPPRQIIGVHLSKATTGFSEAWKWEGFTV